MISDVISFKIVPFILTNSELPVFHYSIEVASIDFQERYELSQRPDRTKVITIIYR